MKGCFCNTFDLFFFIGGSMIKAGRTKISQLGRSMVEMLGVLMLMGFLSVGGVLVFRYVMTTYQAGEIQDETSRAKVLVSSRQVRSLTGLQKFVDKTPLKSYESTVEIQDVSDDVHTNRIYKVGLKNISPKLQQAIYARKDNFAKMDMLVVPDESVDTDTADSWKEAGMHTSVYNFFREKTGLLNEKSPSQELAIYFIRKVRVIGEGDVPVSGLSPAECPADMPYQDVLTDSCLRCNPEINAHWQDETQTCVICDEPKTVWDNVTQKCECPFGLYGDNCEPCDSPKEWRENACQCPIGKHEKDGDCVQCLNDTHCSGLTPVCNASNSCEECPSGTAWKDTSCQPLHTITLRNLNTTTTQNVIEGDDLEQPTATFSGFEFSHWAETPGGSAITFPITITGDKTLYAYYKEQTTPTETAETPLNRCGGSRLGSEHTYTSKTVTKDSEGGLLTYKFEVYLRSAWNNDGYNCSGKQGNFAWKLDGVVGSNTPTTSQCSWISVGTGNELYLYPNSDWSKYCDVVWRAKARTTPILTYPY